MGVIEKLHTKLKAHGESHTVGVVPPNAITSEQVIHHIITLSIGAEWAQSLSLLHHTSAL